MKNIKNIAVILVLSLVLSIIPVATEEPVDYVYQSRTNSTVTVSNEDINELALAIADVISSKYVYEASIQYMQAGYVDVRPEYTIQDEAYLAWRDAYHPTWGKSTHAVSVPIKVSALDTNVDQRDIDYVVELIAFLPQGFLRQMSKDGWQIFVSGNDLESEYASDGLVIAGQTNHKTKTICVRSGSLNSIYHEIGHVLAEHYCRAELKNAGLYEIATDTELDVLYNHRANGSVYIYMNPSEQIADSLYDFVWYPFEMNTQAPTLYNIFYKALNAYN